MMKYSKNYSFEQFIISYKRYMKESEKCADNRNYLSAHIVLGSALEALIKGYLLAFTNLQEKDLEKESLYNLIETFNQASWFRKSVINRARDIRELRNAVHPNCLTKDRLKKLATKRGWQSTKKKFDRILDYFETII